MSAASGLAGLRGAPGLVGHPGVLDELTDERGERDLHEAVDVELGEQPECVARVLGPAVAFAQRLDERPEVPGRDERVDELDRRRSSGASSASSTSRGSAIS